MLDKEQRDHLDTRGCEELDAALALAQHMVYKKYLNELACLSW